MMDRMAIPTVQRLERRMIAGVSARVWLALGLVYVIWGSTYLAIRAAVTTMPPYLFAGVRFLVAGGVLYALSIRRGDPVADRPGRRQWTSATIAGGLLLLGGNGGVAWAEQHIPIGVTALVIATVPLWMVVLGRVVFGDRITLREAIGVLVGFGGLVLLVGVKGSDTKALDLVGVGVALVAAVSWATGSLYSRRAALPKRALVSAAMQMLAGGVLLLVTAAATGEFADVHLAHISPQSWAGLAYLIVFGSLIAFNAYAWLLQNARISLVSTYAYVNPVVAVFLGWAILSEPITWVTLVAGVVIVVAVALIVSAKAPKPAAAPPEPVAAPGGKSGRSS
jgi:drug/metabolite transporter (DMT)-like permease